MKSLQAMQQDMQLAILSKDAYIPAGIRGDGIADANSRLHVYRHGYHARLRDALKVEFTGLRTMAGRRFEPLLDKYIQAHPSGHYNVRWYGAGLAAFLDYAQPWRERPQLAEMARLDWAISVAFDAADQSSIGATEFSAIPPTAWPRLCLVMQQNLQILDCRCNVQAFRRAADRDERRPRLHRFDSARKLLVWRQHHTVHYRQLDEDESEALSNAIGGESFATLCEKLASWHGEAAALPRMVTLLQTWLKNDLVHEYTLKSA